MGKGINEHLEHARTLIQEYEERVLHILFPETAGKKIEREGDFSIRRGVGNPASLHYRVENFINNNNYVFCAKFYRQVPETYKASISPSQKAYESYAFLRNAGIDEVPKAIFLKDNPNWLFMEFVKGKTMREILEEEKDEKRKRKIFENFAKSLPALVASYQHKATISAALLDRGKRESLFWARSEEEQADEYLSTCLGDKDKAKQISREIYMPLFGDALKGNCIVHGDFGPDNTFFDEATGAFSIIDHELKERNEMADLGSYIAYLGDYENYWKKIAEDFRSEKFRMLREEQGIKTKVMGFLPGGIVRASDILSSEMGKRALFELVANINFYSLRIAAKRKKFKDRNYEQQEKNLANTLEMLSLKPGEFGINDEKARLAEELGKYFKTNNAVEQETCRGEIKLEDKVAACEVAN